MPHSNDIDLSCTCPNCGNVGMEIVYAIDNIPVHSTINIKVKPEAFKFPTGNLRLVFCHQCAFLSNTLYDASMQEYSNQCEESQHVSPTFTKFARTLAQRWIDRYDLRNKTIIEVGCGKGEFLTLMCEMGNNRGVGIDPSYQPWRNTSPAVGRMRFITDLYSEKYTHIEGDAIMCRHTLEHIGQTGDFLKMIRRAIGPRKDMLVLFELPDVTRVLKEGAFWDIYYEHCSYFSPGSLARLFRQSGFELLELERDYGDQYLLIAGRPIDTPSTYTLPLENDLEDMKAIVATFKATVNQSIENWRTVILDIRKQGKKAVIWSALSKAVSFMTTLKVGDAVAYATDINPHRQNLFFPTTGTPIVPPSFLKEYQPDYVILMNPIYVPEVQKDLDAMGVKAKILPVGVEPVL